MSSSLQMSSWACSTLSFTVLHSYCFFIWTIPIIGQPLGLTFLFLIFCTVSGYLIHIAGTLCPHTFIYHLCLYLTFILFSNTIFFPTPFLFCSLAHRATPMRLLMDWHILNCQ